MRYFKKGNGKDVAVKVVNNKVITTIRIGGHYISNPTLEQFLAQGWEEYVPPIVHPRALTGEEYYKKHVVELIRERYDIDDELAILRQRETKVDEFTAYNNYVEDCKEQARIDTEEHLNNAN